MSEVDVVNKYKILKDLVKFNTIKDKENKEIINYLEHYLLQLGFTTEYKGKYLIMSIGEKPQIGFLGHTDTVEYIEGWKTNPFELVNKDGILYGLGVCDMKGGIAAMLEAISQINLDKIKNGIKVYFTYDEEIGFGGTYDILKRREKFPDLMIFGEPTDNEILVGSKGILEYVLKFKGEKAHSSNPEKGKSANMNAVKFLSELDEFYQKNIRIFEDKTYDIPYTTMNVGLINGGKERNSVAANCDVSIDFRIVKKEHIGIIKEKINSLAWKYNFEINIIECLEPFINKTDLTEEIKTANFLTEASVVNSKSKIILGLGPVTAHEINEHITEESYRKLVNQYREIIEKNVY